MAEWDEVTQSILYTPELNDQGVFGNCLQAAVASALKRPLHAVPHFVTFAWWPQAMTLWAYGEGLRVMGDRAESIPHDDRVYVVGGKSPRGVSHVVIGHRGAVVWDPHPSRAGLMSISDVTWFEPLDEDAGCPLLWGPVVGARQLEALGYTVTEPEAASV